MKFSSDSAHLFTLANFSFVIPSNLILYIGFLVLVELTVLKHLTNFHFVLYRSHPHQFALYCTSVSSLDFQEFITKSIG